MAARGDRLSDLESLKFADARLTWHREHTVVEVSLGPGLRDLGQALQPLWDQLPRTRMKELY